MKKQEVNPDICGTPCGEFLRPCILETQHCDQCHPSVYVDMEFLELCCVTVPVNPDALKKLA